MIFSRKVAKLDTCFRADSDQEIGHYLHQQVHQWQEVGVVKKLSGVLMYVYATV